VVIEPLSPSAGLPCRCHREAAITMNAAQRVEVLESKRIKDVVAAKYLEKFLTSPHASKSILACACRAPPTRACFSTDKHWTFCRAGMTAVHMHGGSRLRTVADHFHYTHSITSSSLYCMALTLSSMKSMPSHRTHVHHTHGNFFAPHTHPNTFASPFKGICPRRSSFR
jgi:hypothetical protein